MGGFIALVVIITIGAGIYAGIKQIKDNQKRKIDLIDKYGEELGMTIFNKLIKLGFSEEMLFESWGKPGKEEKKLTKDKVRVKYYFGAYKNQQGNTKYSTYAVVENGIVIETGDIKR